MNPKTISVMVVFAALSLVTSTVTSTAFATHNNGNGKDPHAVNPSCDNPNQNVLLKNKNCDIDDNEGDDEEEDNEDDNEDNPGDGNGGEV
jgi:hypothetical protein